VTRVGYKVNCHPTANRLMLIIVPEDCRPECALGKTPPLSSSPLAAVTRLGGAGLVTAAEGGGRRLALSGAVIIVVFATTALGAPWLAPYHPQTTNWSKIRKPADTHNWLGTDDLGRDVLSRVIWGAQVSLLAGVLSVLLAVLVSVPLGLIFCFERHISEGRITVKPRLERIDGHNVRFVDNSESQVDVIVFATGYRFAMPFLPETIRAPAGYPLAAGGECRQWPGLFVFGVPCAVRGDSHFLHGIAADAPIVAAAIARRVTTSLEDS